MAESLESACRSLLDAVYIGDGKVLVVPVIEQPLRRIVAAMVAEREQCADINSIEQRIRALDCASVTLTNRGLQRVEWRSRPSDGRTYRQVQLYGIEDYITLVMAPESLVQALGHKVRVVER